MKLGVLLIRADASLAIGTGHVMRCLALAQAWRDAGGNAVFSMADDTPAVEERLRNEGFEIARAAVRVGSAADAEETAQLAHQHGASWVVVDGYEFGAEYQADLKSHGLKVLFIDDNGHAAHYSADLVLNQNAHAREEIYGKRAPGTRLLLGSRYTLLRNEFTVYRDWERNVPERGTRVLLTMGGSDPKDLTPGILSAIADLPIDGLQIRVVVGGSTENRSGVAEEAEKYPGRVEVMSNVANMAELMAWADLAIAGAGTTCWEMCLLGVPAILVVVAENQKFIARQLAQMGAAVNAGPAELIDCSALAQVTAALLENRDRRLKMSQSARQLVDGLGSERVRAALLNRELSLRLVRESDCRLLFEWADDPVARAASFHSGAISWEDHARWFAERLQDAQSVIYIGENAAGERVGVVRFQINGESAVLSVNVAPEFRGQGWGKELIALATRSLVRARSARRIDALVKPDNQASVRLFEASGFRRAGTERVADQDALLFTWECGNGIHVN